VRRTQFPDYIKFLIVGGAGTAMHYLVMAILIQWIGVPPVMASTLGAICGAIVVYTLNYHYTFATQGAHLATVPKFLVLAGLGLLLNAAVVAGLLDVGVPVIAAQVCATGLVLLFNFVVSKRWVFQPPKNR
jgi:putative flippase GtrA